jgi:hypothetical protein
LQISQVACYQVRAILLGHDINCHARSSRGLITREINARTNLHG